MKARDHVRIILGMHAGKTGVVRWLTKVRDCFYVAVQLDDSGVDVIHVTIEACEILP